MGFWDYITNKAAVLDNPSGIEVVTRQDTALGFKDYDYTSYTPEASVNGAWLLNGPNWQASWTEPKDYAAKAKLMLSKCPVSQACIGIRSQALAGIGLDITSTRAVKNLLTTPNGVDKTLSSALKSWEVQLCIGGDLFLFWDFRVPGLPQLSSLRQDLVVNNIKASRWEYVPGLLSGDDRPLMVFPYDGAGTTTSASIRSGQTYSTINASLQRIAYYNPTSPIQGLAPSDAALRSVELFLLCDDLVRRKFESGGAKNGYFTASSNAYTDADLAALEAEMSKLNMGGDLRVLSSGMDFVAAQMTFAELELKVVRDKAADAICSAFGVNSTMVNVGQSTHANLRGMDTILYRNLIGPEAKWLVGQIEWGVRRWLDPNARIIVDESKIQHIQDDIRDNAVALSQLGVLTVNEIRAELGYDALSSDEGGNTLVGQKPASNGATGLGQPDTKPGGDTAFNANSGNRGDQNANG